MCVCDSGSQASVCKVLEPTPFDRHTSVHYVEHQTTGFCIILAAPQRFGIDYDSAHSSGNIGRPLLIHRSSMQPVRPLIRFLKHSDGLKTFSADIRISRSIFQQLPTTMNLHGK